VAEPITPARVYPAGTPLPPRAPEPGELPPWRTPPPPPVPPAAAPPPPAPVPPPVPQQVIHVIHQVVLAPAEPEPQPTWWDRIRTALRRIGKPWQLAAALGASVFPIPPAGYSLGTTWMYVVHQTRLDHGAGWGYALGAGALALTATLVGRRPTLPRLTLLAIAFIGAFGAVALADPITALTGVS
jgi:hypothetical protein